VFTGECPGPSCVNPYCEDCGGNVCTLDESEHDRSMLSSSRILVNKDSGTGTSFNISLLCQPPGSLGAAGAGAVTTLPTGEKGISTAIIPIVETTTLTTTTKPATTTEVVATTETTTVYWEKGMPVQLSILDRIRQIIFGIIGLRV